MDYESERLTYSEIKHNIFHTSSRMQCYEINITFIFSILFVNKKGIYKDITPD